MTRISPAAALAWKIAMLEALLAGSEYIEKEHLFIGLCSLDKLLSVRDLKEKSTAARAILYERDAIDFSLRRAAVDATGLRRGVRRSIPRRERPGKRDVIHRSQDCRKFFDRAHELAESHPITGIHLLTAILENPGPAIRGILEPRAGGENKPAGPKAGTVMIRSLQEFENTKKEERQVRSTITRSRHTLASLPPESDRSVLLRSELRAKTIRVARLCLALGDLAGVAAALRDLAALPGCDTRGISSLCAQLLFLHAEGISLGPASLHQIEALLAELKAAAGQEGS